MKKPNFIVFFDFDNTITACDVIDDMLLRFSKDKRWLRLEEDWRKGKIGSRSCLQGQIKGIRITKNLLDNYLLQLKLDSSFKKIIRFLGSKNIKIIILSDNFAYIIRRILRNNGIRNPKIYSNGIRFARDRLIPFFLLGDRKCRVCAHCKKNSLLANIRTGIPAIYIGDGLFDICPAKYADIVFAKGDLLRYDKSKKLGYIPYKTLNDVYGYFRRSLKWKVSKK